MYYVWWIRYFLSFRNTNDKFKGSSCGGITMGQAKIIGGSGLSIPNSIDQEYYAESGTIKSNLFLQYVETRTLHNEITKLNSKNIGLQRT